MTKLLNAVEAQLDDFNLVHLHMVWWALGKLAVRPSPEVSNRFFGRFASVLVDMQTNVRASFTLSVSASCTA